MPVRGRPGAALRGASSTSRCGPCTARRSSRPSCSRRGARSSTCAGTRSGRTRARSDLSDGALTMMPGDAPRIAFASDEVNVELEFTRPLRRLRLRRRAAGAGRVDARGDRAPRLPVPPLRAGARRARRACASRRARRWTSRGYAQPRPLVGLPRRLRLPPPPLDLRELRATASCGGSAMVETSLRRAQARRLRWLDGDGPRPDRARRRVRRLLAGAGRAAARPRPRRHATA